jgi:hypothetical protein
MKKPQRLCQGQKKLHAREIKTSSCERKEKNVLWSCERERRNKIGEIMGKWILLIKIGEYFHSLKLFG